MTHRIHKLILFLLFGALVNIAVAWASLEVRWHEMEPAIAQMDRAVSDLNAHIAYETASPERPKYFLSQVHSDRWREWSRSVGASHLLINIIDIDAGDGNTSMAVMRCALASGKPFVSVRAPWRARFLRPGESRQTIMDVLVPVWPGFAMNTIFYAGVLGLLFAFPFALRRWRRIKRGLCPACAYDLRGSISQACPECGKVIKR